MTSGPAADRGGVRGQLGSLGRDIGVYGFSGVLVQAVAVVTVPVFARRLGAADYGRLDLLAAVIALVVTGCGDAVGSGTIRSWVSAQTDAARQEVLGSGLALASGFAIASGLLVVLGARPLLQADLPVGVVVAAAVSVPPAVLARFWMDVLRVQRRSGAYLACAVCRGVLTGVIGVVLVIHWHPTITSVLIGTAVGSAAAAAIGWVMAGRRLRPRLSSQHSRAIASFGLPLIPVALAGWSLMLVDRILIAHMEPAAELGAYAVANRVTSVLLLLVYSFGTAWTPYVLTLGTEDPAGERRLRPVVLRTVIVGVGFVGVGVSAVAPEVLPVFVGAGYASADPVVPLLCVAMLFFAVVPVAQTPMLLGRRTKDMAVMSIVAAVVNVIACLVLIPPYGIQGAAWASIIGFGVQGAAYFAQGQRVLPATFAWRRMVVALALPTISLVLLWRLVATDSGLGPRLAVVVVFPIIAIALRAVTLAEARSLLRRPTVEPLPVDEVAP